MKKHLLLFIFLSFSIKALSQNNSTEWTYDSLKSYYEHFANSKNDTSYDGYWTKYLRFTLQNDYKYSKNQKISDYVNAIEQFNAEALNRNISTPSTTFLASNWTNITEVNSTESAAGRFMSIWINPNPPYNIIAGSQSSGIWKTKNGHTNPNWKNLSSFKMKNFGVSQIAVPEDTNIIYASAAFSGSYVSYYGTGIVYSTDAGENWTKDNTVPLGFNNVADWQLKIRMPLKFKPNTTNLYVAREAKIGESIVLAIFTGTMPLCLK